MRASPAVIAARLLLLLAAAAALASAVVLAGARDRAGQAAGGRYVCPMHAEVVSAAPGDCPICGMALERVKGGAPPPAANGDRVVPAKPSVLASQIRAPAWLAADGVVTAILHEDDFVGMPPGAAALFFPASAPASGVDVRLSAESPEKIDASTSRVRFLPARGARPGRTDVGLLQIAARPRDVLVVPASAVLYSADGPYVLAAPRAGAPFAKRPVQIGRILDSSYAAGVNGDNIGTIVVLSGLRAGERVVAGDTFFADAERRLRLARGEGERSP